MTPRDHAARVAAGHPVTGLDYLLLAASVWRRCAALVLAALAATLLLLATRTPTYEAARVWRVTPTDLGESLQMAVDWQAIEPRTPVQVQRRGPYVRAVAVSGDASALVADLDALNAWLDGEVAAGRAVLERQRQAAEADRQMRQERRAARLRARAAVLRARAAAATARSLSDAERQAARAYEAAQATYRRAVAAHEAALARRPTAAMVAGWRAEIARIEATLPTMPATSAAYWTSRALTLQQRVEAAGEPPPPAPSPPAPPEAITVAPPEPPLEDDAVLDDPPAAGTEPTLPEAVVLTDRSPSPLEGRPWTWPLVTAAVGGAALGLGWAYVETWWIVAWLRREPPAPDAPAPPSTYRAGNDQRAVIDEDVAAVQRWS